MQTQSVAQSQSITSAQSLTTVQTLLRAGLGCITYLRDLLPADNFSESHFISSNEDSLCSQSSITDSSPTDHKLRRNVSAFKIMTVSRGFTEEGDKLLDYLEHGIFDALKQQYLRSFIFAIYLDNKDPNNIIEAYTFNFNYHTIPGTETVIPVLSFDERSTSARKAAADPVTEAIKKGKPPTLGEVKKSVKALLKRLINATTQMDSLPKRRYATFKLYYNDNTPPDYEPPHFHPGDSVKDLWFFTTHDVQEVPEKWSLGGIKTGHHGVNINIASVTSYLPSSTENNSAVFTGTTSKLQGSQFAAAILTPAQEATARVQQVDIQMRDAEQRNVAWDVKNDDAYSDADADGEDDDDYIKLANGTYKRKDGSETVPIGLRKPDGHIEPLKITEEFEARNKIGNEEGSTNIDPLVAEEAYFGGVSEQVPSRVGELNTKVIDHDSLLDQTQQLDSTQGLDLPSPGLTMRRRESSSSVAVTDAFASIKIDAALVSPSLISTEGIGIDTQMLNNLTEDVGTEDCEMLDMETQAMPPVTTEEDPIESFDPSEPKDMVDDVQSTPMTNKSCKKVKEAKDLVDNGLQCECGVSIEDECTFCEGGCGRWFHIWCMGYHAISDKRIPAKFVCFDCRVRADLSWDLIEVHLYPQMISKFKDLALFRRAIKIAEAYEPKSVSEFTKHVGCDNVVARQLFKRLEVEGFVATETKTTDELGLLETCSRAVKGKGKGKGKQANQRKNLQKTKYLFNKSSKRTPAYKDYFNPDQVVENRLLGLSDLKASFKTPKKATDALVDVPLSRLPSLPAHDTQTQEESQMVVPATPLPIVDHSGGGFKRKTTDVERPSKKVKISMGLAVDLGD